MGFNNQPKQDEDEQYLASTWYIDQEMWDAVRTGNAAEGLAPRCTASQHDGYVRSLTFAHEVATRQRRAG